MKFKSIFSQRALQEDLNRLRSAHSAASRTARLLGVPESQLTPEVRAALSAMMGEINELRSETDRLRRELSEAEACADFDPLVPVYNRRAFMREASRVVAMVRRHEIEASLIFFDLDSFKRINDTLGHAAGDAVLRAVGQVLLRQTREEDIVGRIGGDEFAVVLTHVNEGAVRDKAEMLAAAIARESVRHEGVKVHVGVSWGASAFHPTEGAEQVLARADEAMYGAKQHYFLARA